MPQQDAVLGYAETVFEGKNEQMESVCSLISEKGFVPRDLVRSEVAWFYSNLGIDDSNFYCHYSLTHP